MRKYDRHTKPAAIVGAALFAIAASGLAASDAKAEYPERPITVVISYGPGGATDIAGRTLTNSLSKIVPQPVLAVNRAGAGGATGAASVKNADHIIVLDEGRVVQTGTHEQLIAEPGYYQDIYNQQLEEKLSGQDG